MGGRNRLIEQIQRPALLIRLISLLPEVNYHTHTSCCCSTYIIITVARMENGPKLTIPGLPSPASHTGCKHPLLQTGKVIASPPWRPHQYFLPEPFSAFPNPPPHMHTHTHPHVPAVFWIDFIYLMMAALMTLRTRLMV